jgi:hypothetical protein
MVPGTISWLCPSGIEGSTAAFGTVGGAEYSRSLTQKAIAVKAIIVQSFRLCINSLNVFFMQKFLYGVKVAIDIY